MTYSILLFVHLLGAFLSFATAALEVTAVLRMRRARTVVQVLEWSWLCGPTEIAHRIGGPMLLLSGLAMEQLTWGWNRGWINVSIRALVAIALTGATQVGPRLAAIHRVAASVKEGPLPEAVTAKLADPALMRITGVLIGSALGVTFVMAAKPSGLTSIGIVAVGAVVGIATQRSGAQQMAKAI